MVAVEFEPWLIIIAALLVIVEGPAATSSMHEVTELVLLPRPEALYTAALPEAAPFVGK
jgi:hypothetical protein